MIILDSSSLVRFFTNDIPEKAIKVKGLLDSKKLMIIPSVVFPELEYVLTGEPYKGTRKELITSFQYLVTKKNIIVSKEVKLAVALYHKTKLDIADCIIVASSYEHELFSFDEEMMKVKKALS